VESFARFAKIQPNVSSAFALMGLCFFQLQDYGNSLAALTQAERLGLPQGEQLADVASYHAAMLFTRDGNFEKALQILNLFSRRENIEPKLIELAGIAALRKSIFPGDLPADDRELVFRTGRAVMTAGARRTADANRMFEELIRDFPTAAHLRYVYGNLLLGSDPEAALRQFEQELKLQPEHLPSLVVMGLEYVRQNRFAEAKPVAEKAVRIAPENFTTHTLLGRALAEGDLDIPGGVAALEKAVALEPGSPQVRIALAAAYAKAGRREDAAKQRAEFLRLKKILEGNAAP
jgi:tetratricopeptide (TPR) repeat protein